MAARPWYLLSAFALFAATCATGSEGGGPSKAAEPAPVAAPALEPVLASRHCNNGRCVCAREGEDEAVPPPGKKRIEIRMSATAGSLTLDSPSAGHFAHAGGEQACYYLDLDINKLYSFHLASKEGERGSGVTPSVRIREYGPIARAWYDIVDVTCGTGDRGCDPGLARAWGQAWLDTRKRGRLDACGSLVVVGLKWSTSGGRAEADGWLLRDFDADFGLEVKKFATEFPPGARECQIGHETR